MPILDLPSFWVVGIDIAAWFFFHVTISIACLKIPASFFRGDSFIYRIKRFEEQGNLWQRLFKVKSWKKWIPDGTVFLKDGFNKEKLTDGSSESLILFLNESKRAELTHWLSILPAPLFFLWNPVWAGWVMILYALALNIPIIISQRYNRARIERIEYKRKKQRI